MIEKHPDQEEPIQETGETTEPIENIDKFLRSLAASHGNTGKQEKTLEKLVSSEGLLEKYLRRSPECKEIFTYLEETLDALNELSGSSVQLNINETNTEVLLSCLEKVVLFYQRKHKESLEAKREEANQMLLVEKQDFRTKLTVVYSNLLTKYFKLITKCLQMKSSTKKTLTLQETCVRLLTFGVQFSPEYARQIALEYDCWNVYKNWLEKFLLLKQTDLREYSVQLLMSYFKHVRAVNGEKKKTVVVIEETSYDHEHLALIKKIFLARSEAQSVGMKSKSSGGKTVQSSKGGTSAAAGSTLINCLFSHVNTDSYEVVEFLLQEFLFKFVQNEAFNKSDKIRLFNEKTLGQLIKLFEWSDHRPERTNKNNQTLLVRQMITEFLKILFSSTRYGISFYDRSLNIDLSAKNFNHLIFNSLINIQRPVGNDKDKKTARACVAKTNELIDELVLKSLKVCPDLIQRFLKVKQKQEADQFIPFCGSLFEQQLTVIKKMRKNLCGPTSFLRSLAFSGINLDGMKTFLCDLITHTSMPLCISFQKVLTAIFNSKASPGEKITRYNDLLRLLIASLRCIKEWQECLKFFQVHRANLDFSDATSVKVQENLVKILDSKQENFNSKLNLELLTKHLPKFDVFCDSILEQILKEENKEDSNTKSVIISSFDIFSLYFDIFMTKSQQVSNQLAASSEDMLMDESDDLIGSCFNFLQIETLEQNLVRLIPALLQLSSDNLISKPRSEESSTNSINLCLKYLKFLIKYLSLKHDEQCVEEMSNFDVNDSESNADLLFDSRIRASGEGSEYLVDYNNLTMLNLVKIVFKFKEQALFKNLIGYFLKLTGIYLDSEYEIECNNSLDTFKFERNSMYLWFNLVRKHFIESSTLTSNELNPLIDYVYFCLTNLLSQNQRNFILFQMNLNEGHQHQQDTTIGFNQLLAFISIKNYLVFNGLSQAMPQASLTKIQAFLFDYIFSSSLTIENNTQDLETIFDRDLSNQLLFKKEGSKDVLADLSSKLKSRLLEVLGQCDKADCCSEVFMIHFERYSNLANLSNDKNLTVVDLNLNLRMSHCLFLAKLAGSQKHKFSIEKDLDLIIQNLKNCLKTIDHLSTINPASIQKTDTSSTTGKEAIEIEEETFLVAINSESHLNRIKAIFGAFEATERTRVQTKLNMDLVSEFNMEEMTFKALIDDKGDFLCGAQVSNVKSMDQQMLQTFEFFAKILIRNQRFLFEKGVSLFKEFDLDQKFIASLESLAKCTNIVLTYAARFDLSKTEINADIRDELCQFLVKAHDYKPSLFKLLVKMASEQSDKADKYLKKFSASNAELTNLLSKSGKETKEHSLTQSELEFLAINSVDDKYTRDIGCKSIEKLVEMYRYTLSLKDRAVLKQLYKLDPKLDCLLFKLESDGQTGESLRQQPKIVDFIGQRLTEMDLLTASQNFPINRKLSDLQQELRVDAEFDLNSLVLSNDVLDSKIYDPIYLLPNIYCLLDYGNIVDVVQFVNSRCLSYLFAALSCECESLRSLAYAALYRFSSHLQNSRAFFKNIIVYLITLLRNSTDKENLHLPTVISAFLAEACMIIKEPGTSLYKPIIQFMLLKPTLDFTNVPEYYKLFNSSSANYKLERKWILSILAASCRTSLDFRLFEKRFVYRQLLAIYDSKISDADTKNLILTIVLRACSCKYALIQLVKRHYLLVWLSNALEGGSCRKGGEMNLPIFYKLIQIYILVWSQLGTNRAVTDPETNKEQILAPPLTFLNQMLILMKLFLKKLINNHARLNELKIEVELKGEGEAKLSLDLDKLVIKNFFKVKRELTESIQKFNLDLIRFESNDNMDTELDAMGTANNKASFSDVLQTLEKRKRACDDLFVETTTKTIKKQKIN